jgi:hypothetical protein
MNKYPIYIPSKGRADSRLTVKTLDYMKVNYKVVVEKKEYKEYSKVINKNNLLVLDKKYQDNYNTCDDLGDTKSKGPGAARNFVWEHSISEGYKKHWVIDDNINGFYRLNNNLKIKVYTGKMFKAMEDFCERYTNVTMAGPNYLFFAKQNQKLPPFITNTRIYSCNLIKNNTPHRWRGRYNEDTILSLDMLKDGYCTVQFNAFLQGKVRTQVLRGGNSAEFYDKEGTLPKSQMQVDVHPDVSKLVWKFGRVHHHVDYSKFKANRLIKKKDIKIQKGINEYGMNLKQIK